MMVDSISMHIDVLQAYLKQKMEQQFQAQQASVLARLAQLETAAAAPAASATATAASVSVSGSHK
jgi:hypothetical protein